MPSGRVFLAGGAELQPGCEEMDECLLRETGGAHTRLVYLPTATARHNPARNARVATDYFARLGVRCEVAMILDQLDANDPVTTSPIAGADLIYLGGGDPAILLTILQGSLAWEEALRAAARGAMIGGSSAGAMVVCSHTLLVGMRHADGETWVEGLGLVPDTLVVPHFSQGNSSAVTELAAALVEKVAAAFTVFAIAEQTALLSDAGSWEIAGRGTVTRFHHGHTHTFTNGEHTSHLPCLR